MKTKIHLIKLTVTAILLGCLTTAQCNAEIFLSFSGLGEGNANAAPATTVSVGEQGVVYIWFRDDLQVDTGAFVDILNSDTEVLRFTSSTVYNPEILSAGSAVDTRWQAVKDGTVTDGLVDELSGVRFLNGTGVLTSQVTGSTLEDAFHDAASSAFLFGSVNFVAVAEGNATLSMAVGDGLIVDNGVALSPTFRSGIVSVTSVPEPSGVAILLIGVGSFLMRRSRHTSRRHLS